MADIKKIGTLKGQTTENKADSFTIYPRTTASAVQVGENKLLSEVLKTFVTKDDINKVFKYKGSVASINNLPTINNEVGDVYNVGSDLSGPNYAWTGEEWDLLGAGTIAYSNGDGLNLSNNVFSLTSTGVNAGTYGQSSNTTITSSGVISVPQFTVNSQGRITSASNKNITISSNANTLSFYAGTSTGSANAATTNGNTNLIVANGGTASRVKITGDGNVNVISDNAGKITVGYNLPTATSSTLGGVKIGNNITISNGAISVNKANITNALGYTPISSTTTYTLPNATSNTLGGVKIGSNININNGTISITSANITSALGYTPIGTAGTINNYYGINQDLGSVSGNITIDPTVAAVFSMTINGETSVSINYALTGTVITITLIIIHNTGDIYFPNVRWTNGIVPIFINNGIDILTFLCTNNKIFGFVSLQGAYK